MNRSQKLPDDSQLTTLYRASRKEQPSEALDQAILSEARKVASKRRNRWIVPLSSAALVLLGVGLSLPLIELPYKPSQQLKTPTILKQDSYPEADIYLKKAPVPAAPASAPALPYSIEESATGADSSSTIRRQALTPKMTRSLDTASNEKPEAELQAFGETGAELTPVAWLNQIELLIESNQLQAAKQQLEQFRLRFPEYPLPDSLKLWLIEN